MICIYDYIYNQNRNSINVLYGLSLSAQKLKRSKPTALS